MKLRNILLVLAVLAFLMIFAIAIMIDVYAWKTFVDETGAEISYLKWLLLYSK